MINTIEMPDLLNRGQELLAHLTANAVTEQPTASPADNTRPKPNESWTDPHRLSRLYAAKHRTPDGDSTLALFQGAYHLWGVSWRSMPDDDLNAELAVHARTVFEADMPARLAEAPEGKPPSLPAVTKNTIANVRVNLAGMVNLPDTGDCPPFWIGGPAGRPDPADVIAAPNGLFTLEDIAAGKGPFAPPTPRLFTLNALPFPVPKNPSPPVLWLAKLDEWFNGDKASIDGLGEWLGYLLTANTAAHKLLLLIGRPRSGKGTILRTMTELVGASNVASTTFAAFGESFGLEPLVGKPVAVIPDARLSGRTDTAAVVERLLSVSGEDVQSINRKHQRRITANLRCRFVLASNEMPRLPDASGAVTSRFHILSLPNSWEGKEDRDLGAKLTAELAGILRWAAEGWVRLKANGLRFTPNDAAKEHRKELERLSSPIKTFIKECCVIGPDHEVEISAAYTDWRYWNWKCGRQVSSEAVFGRDMRAALPHLKSKQENKAGEERKRKYLGIKVKNRSEWGEDEEETKSLSDVGDDERCS